MSEITNNVKTWECGKENAGDVIAILENVTLRIRGIGEMDNFSDKKGAPWQGENYIKIVIENGVKSIGNYAFKHSFGLNNIEIAQTVLRIGFRAFFRCTALKEIVIPDNVTTLDGYCFSECQSLRSIKIPKSVKSIGYGIFAKCDKFSLLINERETPQDIGSQTFMEQSSSANDNYARSDNFKLFVPESAIEKYRVAPEWQNFKNIFPIENSALKAGSSLRQIDDEILNLEREKTRIIERIYNLKYEKALMRGIAGNPKQFAKFMSLFDRKDGLKYLTHDYDRSDDFKYDEILSNIKEVCVDNFDLEIPITFIKLIIQFVFEKQPNWKSFTPYKYTDKVEELGWSADRMDNVKPSKLHPIKFDFFNEAINSFKRLTRVENEQMNNIADKVFGNKGFVLIKNDLKNAYFYTHVGEFISALETIFSEIEKRTDTDAKKKIAVSYKRETSGDYFVRKIIITHLNSYPTRNDKKALLKEWVSFEKGSMAKIAEHLQGYCHWSVETKVDGKPVRVNILREKETEPYEYADIENVDGFTHILTFYYQS